MEPEPSRLLVDDDSDLSDDDAIYNADFVELMPGIHTNELELYEPVPEHRDGAIKSSVEGRESGQFVYHRSKADCSVSITRLLWADGWRSPDHSEAMTLVVLKLGFKPESRSAKVTYASLKLRLKSDKEEDQDPRLVAWGPFRHPEKWNVVDAHRRINVTPTVKLGAGGAGQEVSVGVDGTIEIEWDERYTDYGLSSEKYNKSKTGPPNGVLWQVFQNERLKRGITHEIRVAALFSRPPPSDHYRVEVRIVADTGIGSKLLHKGMRLFGQPGGDRVYWRVTERLGSRDNCHAEGDDIIKDVDLDNLGKLVDPKSSTNLNPKWLNKWERDEMLKATAEPEAEPVQEQLEIRKQPMAVAAAYSSSLQKEARQSSSEREQAFGSMQMRQVPLDADAAMGRPLPPPRGAVSLATSTPQPVNTRAADRIQPQASGDPDIVTATSRSPDLHHHDSRLVALEDRAARAEARIAEQDQHIIELQRTLTRVAQALLAVGR